MPPRTHTTAPASSIPTLTARERAQLRTARSLLRPLGIVGYGAAEPALLAALATDAPLLLVSDHGAAKSLLLERLAHALGLELRHYNASLLQYDDLVGFPIPDDDGTVRFAAPPGAIWGAEAVFLDEIGRCRPDVANKLFPIVHERRVQGIRLDRLRFRWAATNPPAEARDGGDEDDALYAGVEPLDAALADRFDWVVALPRFAELADRDRRDIIAGIGTAPTERAADEVRDLVAATRALVPAVDAALGDALTDYVLALVSALERAAFAVGGRRAATLRRNLVAGWAAHLAMGRPVGERAIVTLLRCAIPDRVRRVVADTQLLAVHRQAWEHISLEAGSPEQLLSAASDPIERAILAATLPGLDRLVRGEAISHAIPTVPPRIVPYLAWLLLARLGETTTVPAATLEVLADLVHPVVTGGIRVVGQGIVTDDMIPVRQLAAGAAPSTLVGEMVLNVVALGVAKRWPALTGAGATPLGVARYLLARHTDWCAALGLDPATVRPLRAARPVSTRRTDASSASAGADTASDGHALPADDATVDAGLRGSPA